MEQPLDLESPSASEARHKVGFSKKWTEGINTAFADRVCLLLCLNTGLCDSCAFNAWACFLAMQTGNTIVLGLGASHQPVGTTPWGWLRSLVSIASFLTGAVAFSQLTRKLGPCRRGTLCTSFAIQGLLIVIAACLIQADLIQRQEHATYTFDRPLLSLIPITLLAFQSAGSINSTRILGYNEIPGVVLTSVYYDIASDPALLSHPSQNAKRNRRIAGVVMLLIGAIIGGWLSCTRGGMAVVLWIAAALKLGISVAWLFWAPAPALREG